MKWEQGMRVEVDPILPDIAFSHRGDKGTVCRPSVLAREADGEGRTIPDGFVVVKLDTSSGVVMLHPESLKVIGRSDEHVPGWSKEDRPPDADYSVGGGHRVAPAPSLEDLDKSDT